MPFYRFEVATPLSPSAALARLDALVTPPRTFLEELKRGFRMRRDTDPPFVGTTTPDAFEVRRDIRYRNSFLPVVRGRIETAPGGSLIKVTMHPVVAPSCSPGLSRSAPPP